MIAVIMKHFEDNYERFLKTQDLSLLMDEYNRQLLNKGRKVRVLQPGHEYTGEALGINKMGDLLVKKEEGTVEAVYAGEVSVKDMQSGEQQRMKPEEAAAFIRENVEKRNSGAVIRE